MYKILVMDDDLSNADAIQMVLETADFEVESINKADQLRPAIDSFSPDLILMDILLEGDDGRDLCNVLKEDECTKDIPVLLITAMLESQVNYIPCKPDGMMFKPFDYSKLTGNIRRLLHAPD